MDYEAVVQAALDEIDRRIDENIRVDELARNAGYSPTHFCRVFLRLTGMSVKNYMTSRKLEFALHALSEGGKILDAAVSYGFETHAGFTKAFKKHYGCPPSLYRLHVAAVRPGRAAIQIGAFRKGVTPMQVQIKETPAMIIAGYPARHRLPGVNGMADIPAFWDSVHSDYAAGLSALHQTYANSRHCEISVCFDMDEEQEAFTYMLGVGVDEADADVPCRPGVYLHPLPGGLYAVFTTPPADEAVYTRSIQEAWRDILTRWLPSSAFAYDGGRAAYEYYDERDHAWLHEGRCRMEIRLPIRRRD